MKRANRLAAHISRIEAAMEKQRGQIRHDQAYIDALESRLTATEVQCAREEIPGRLKKERVTSHPEVLLSGRQPVPRDEDPSG